MSIRIVGVMEGFFALSGEISLVHVAEQAKGKRTPRGQDAGEALLQIATVQKPVDHTHLPDDWPQEAVEGLVAPLVVGQERIEVPGQALPQRRLPGPARTIDLPHHAAQCRKEGVPSNGIPMKKVRGK